MLFRSHTLTHKHTHTNTHTHTLTHSHTHTLTHSLTHSPTHRRPSPPTHTHTHTHLLIKQQYKSTEQFQKYWYAEQSRYRHTWNQTRVSENCCCICFGFIGSDTSLLLGDPLQCTWIVCTVCYIPKVLIPVCECVCVCESV